MMDFVLVTSDNGVRVWGLGVWAAVGVVWFLVIVIKHIIFPFIRGFVGRMKFHIRWQKAQKKWLGVKAAREAELRRKSLKELIRDPLWPADDVFIKVVTEKLKAWNPKEE